MKTDHINLPKWTIAIFSSRESVEILISCIKAAIDASCEAKVLIDVIVNGHRQLADKMAQYADQLNLPNKDAVLRVWFIPVGDKAHAWNEYLHKIWQKRDVAYFIDGYAVLKPDALSLINKGLNLTPTALAASGVPSVGRSAQAMREKMIHQGGIHGNLYAIRGDVLEKMKKKQFRLPLGIYRTDSLIGAVICFGLDPTKYNWDWKRIFVNPDVTWDFRPLTWWRFQDIKSHFKRMLRQSQGELENIAIREHLAVQRKAPEDLPRTIVELVESWLANHPKEAFKLFLKRPSCMLAVREIKKNRDWSKTNLLPLLLSMSSEADSQQEIR